MGRTSPIVGNVKRNELDHKSSLTTRLGWDSRKHAILQAEPVTRYDSIRENLRGSPEKKGLKWL